MAVELKVGKASLGVGGGNGNLKGVTESLKENNRKNDSMDVKLGIIGKILSIESAEEKQARQDAQEFADATREYYEEQQKLAESGVDNQAELLKAQEDMLDAAEDAAEAAEKRSMFDRFAGEEAPSAKVEPTDTGDTGGKTDGSSLLKGLIDSPFGKLVKGFVGILSLVLVPALAFFLNKPEIFNALKKGLISFIKFVGQMVERFGVMNVAIAGILASLATMMPLKTFGALKVVVLTLKGMFMAVLTTLSSFLGIAVAPLVAIIAAIAAVGYALYDTFTMVKQAFDEGASTGELIRLTFIEFFGAFGKILDMAKNLVATVLEFFGFDRLAEIFRQFSFEKIVEDFLAKFVDNGKKLIDSFVNLFSAVVTRVVEFFTDIFNIDYKALFSGILGKAGEIGSKIAGFFGFGDETTPTERPSAGSAPAGGAITENDRQEAILFDKDRGEPVSQKEFRASGQFAGPDTDANVREQYREYVDEYNTLQSAGALKSADTGAERQKVTEERKNREALAAQKAGGPPINIISNQQDMRTNNQQTTAMAANKNLRDTGSGGALNRAAVGTL